MSNSRLPVTRDLSRSYLLSLVVAILMSAVSLAGIFHSAIYPTEDLRFSYVPTDVVNLFIVLPILIGSMTLARQGRLIGLLFWPGALFLVTYHYLAYAVAMPYTWQFAPYLALVALSITTMVGLLSSVDVTAVRGKLIGKVPERFAGGVLAGFGILFLVWRGALVVHALTGAGVLSRPEFATAIAGILLAPVWVVGGVLLWRKKEVGYVVGAGLLFEFSMLFVGLFAYFIPESKNRCHYASKDSAAAMARAQRDGAAF